MLPLMINFTNKPVLIAGGGKIACRRLMVLLDEQADITVVSPAAVDEIQELSEAGRIQWIKRKVKKEDLEGRFLIIAATDDRAANRRIAEEADPLQLINIADEAKDGNTEVPMRASKGRLTIAVSTNGASPGMAKDICSQLINSIDEGQIRELDEHYEERERRKGR